MQFSDTSAEKDGLIQDCEGIVFNDDYGAISGDSDRLATFTRNINTAQDRAVALIMQADNQWQWDDSNYNDYPIATTDLDATQGAQQQDYTLNVSHEFVYRIEVKNNDGNYERMEKIDQSDVRGQALEEFLSDAGMPKYYDLVANSIFLYPKPKKDSVTEQNGLKVYFQRNAERFKTSDTSKSPGIPSTFHTYLSTYASWRYAQANSLENADELNKLVNEYEEQIQSFFFNRNGDDNASLTNGAIRRTSFR